MTFENDFQVKCRDDYEVWSYWLKFLGIHKAQPLSDLFRHIYAVAMTLPHDEPFKGNGMQELRRKINEIPYKDAPLKISDGTFASYKRYIKNKGWLNDDGSLIKNIKQMKEQYKADASRGVRSISLIYKICVC